MGEKKKERKGGSEGERTRCIYRVGFIYSYFAPVSDGKLGVNWIEYLSHTLPKKRLSLISLGANGFNPFLLCLAFYVTKKKLNDR